MPKASLQKHTINLRAGDMEKIQRHLAGRGVDASQVIRGLVAAYVREVVEGPVATNNLEIKIDI